MASSSGAKPAKSKRKISLPWFRQGSVSAPHHSLTRQHTFDTPAGFHARLLRRQPSQPEVREKAEKFVENLDNIFPNSQKFICSRIMHRNRTKKMCNPYFETFDSFCHLLLQKSSSQYPAIFVLPHAIALLNRSYEVI